MLYIKKHIFFYLLMNLKNQLSKFEDYGWEKLYVKHQMKVFRLIDQYDDINHLYLL